ncbi:hypothetical protein G7Y41_07805 [Schaalia sp. ZJ405]|uniref:hypothetical protein n=1 Tax=Schaalia sp. ZJ405 TaxID=2709403 RepID=UPI0013EBE314|nr:hypothetical protein [Schaalia sp. ZJ405]QPK80945.1 hypothetical protein G7Y41_07805 [Schaalia sp. ZJ405]
MDTTQEKPGRIGRIIAMTAMIVFGLLSLGLIGGVMVGGPEIKAVADSLFPWSLGALAVAGIAMLVVSMRVGGSTLDDRE